MTHNCFFALSLTFLIFYTNIRIFSLKMYVLKICHAIITYRNIHVQIFLTKIMILTL